MYIRRDGKGNINLVSRHYHESELGATTEQLPEDHPDVVAFLYPETTLEGVRTAAISRVESGYRQALAALHSDYPDIEREGWVEQIADAKAHQAGEDAPLLATMAAERGISPDDLAARILSKHQQYRTAYAGPTGVLGKLRDEVAAAETVEALEAIDWPT